MTICLGSEDIKIAVLAYLKRKTILKYKTLSHHHKQLILIKYSLNLFD